jgi:amino acid adenylation domain-containing protein
MAYLLHQLLSETAEKYPSEKAVLFNKESITYSELDKASNRLANLLIAYGAKGGDRIAIYMPRNINSIIAIFGILKAGAIYVPIDPLCPENRLSYIINKCEIWFLLSSQEKLNNIRNSFPHDGQLKKVLSMDGLGGNEEINNSIKILYWQKEGGHYSEELPFVSSIIDRDLSYILFTSGSTGIPKGVMISHLNALTFINMACDFFQIKKNDIFSNVSPFHFDLSVFDIYVAFKAGASIVIVPESISMFPSKLAEFIEKNKITIWNSVPSVLSLLATYANLDSFDFSSLRLVLFAGEVFPIKYLRQLKNHIPSAQFYNIYGQTEANSSTCYLLADVPKDDSSLIPIGKPFHNFDVFALDENGKKIRAPGEKGELYVRAQTVASGYWADTEKTNDKFVRNPLNHNSNEIIYRTGDVVRLDNDGNYIFLGRVDHMIKSRGYRIEIGEIETVLSNHPQVKVAVVIPVPDDLIGNRIAVFIVPLNQNNLKKEDILKYCSKQLPKYMIPEIIEFCESLPTTSSGKTDRKQLIELMGKIMANSNKK